MKAIIPVAGTGTRLKPFTSTVPKPLLHVAGKPILAHIIDALIRDGIDELILVIGYKGDKIREYVEKRYDIPLHFVKQEELLGLGYAVSIGLDFVENEPVLIALGDTIIEMGLEKIIASNENCIGVRYVENPSRFGVVEVADGRIISLQEKPEFPKSNLAITGPYFCTSSEALKSALLEIIETDKKTCGEIQLTDALQLMVENGAVFFPEEIRGWFDCGTVETLIETNRHLLDHEVPAQEFENAVLIPPVYIGKGCVIERCIIGPYVSIGDCVVISDSIISDSIIGNGAEIKRGFLKASILGDKSSYRGKFGKMILGDHSQGGYYGD